MPRSVFAIAGLFVGAAVDLLINLLAAALQQRVFGDQFSQAALIGLVVTAGIGLLVGYWLGGPLRVPSSTPSVTAQPGSGAAATSDSVTITRLRALFSVAELRGCGVHLSDILLIGSRVKIDTED